MSSDRPTDSIPDFGAISPTHSGAISPEILFVSFSIAKSAFVFAVGEKKQKNLICLHCSLFAE